MSPAATLVAQRVYDPVLRTLHGANAMLVVLLAASGLTAEFLPPGRVSAWLHHWHGIFGAMLVVGLAGRLVWGCVGPRHARWRDLWHPALWRTLFAHGRFFTAPDRPGHHPAASLAYLVVYTLLLALSASGLLLLASAQGHGPLQGPTGWDAALTALLREPHRLLGWAVAAFVPAHIAAMVLHARLHRIPVAQGMLTGVQYLESK